MTSGPETPRPRRGLALATAVGIALGCVYVLSPLTLLCGMALVALFLWAARGLDAVERRWVLGLLSVALAVRLIMIAGLFAYGSLSHQSIIGIFPDEVYNKQRSLWMRSVWLEIPIFPRYYDWAFETYGWSGYHYVLAFLQIAFGHIPYGPHLLSVVLTLTGAVALHRVVRRSYGPLTAFIGLTLVLLMPSLLAWSIAALKEPMFLCLAMLSLVGAVTVVCATTFKQRAFVFALTVVTVAALGTVRDGALSVTIVGLVGGIVIWFISRRFWRATVAVALVVVALGVAATRPAVQAEYREQIRQAALRHVGSVMTVGYGYKLLDTRFYDDNVRIHDFTLTPNEERRYVIRALVSFVTIPLPWDMGSKSALALLPQQMLWYVLVLLVPFGVVEGLRRDALLTYTLTSYSVINAAAVALNSGNVGTFVRHRDMVVPFIMWLSALGLVSVLSRLSVRGRLALRAHPSRASATGLAAHL